MITHARLGYDNEAQIAILVGEDGTQMFKTYGPEQIGYLWMARFHVRVRERRQGETTWKFYLSRSVGLHHDYRRFYPKFTECGRWEILASPKEVNNEH